MNSQRIAIALFKGTSLTSKIIRWFTWSEYSHVAIIFIDDLMLYESWDGVGVIKTAIAELGKVHKAGTQVDLYRFNCPVSAMEADEMKEYAESQLGKKYDYTAILGFLFRKKWESKNRLFCSEYVCDVLEAGGRRIIKEANYKVPPEAFADSIALERYAGFVV